MILLPDKIGHGQDWAKRGMQMCKMNLKPEYYKYCLMMILAISLSVVQGIAKADILSVSQSHFQAGLQGGKPPERTKERDKEPPKPDRQPPPRDERRDNRRPPDYNPEPGSSQEL